MVEFRQFRKYEGEQANQEPCPQCDGIMNWGREVIVEESKPGCEEVIKELSPGYRCEDCKHIVPG